MDLASKISDKHLELYSKKPDFIIQAPGRINLLGEHVDYNGGTVLPAAIDSYIFLSVSKNEENTIKVYSYDNKEFEEFDLYNFDKEATSWINYIKGILFEINKAGKVIGGFNLVFGGNIPIGAGLSSSAALSSGLAFALDQLFEINLDNISLIKMAQKSENEFVGVDCGIMDQFSSMMGKENHIIQLDCDSLKFEYLPFRSEKYKLVLFDSKVKHQLINTGYNTRVKECKEGLSILKKEKNIDSFNAVSINEMLDLRDKMPINVFRRCKYVVEEMTRVKKAIKALQNNDLESLGDLMFATHEGLKNDYMVSCEEIDFLVDEAKKSTEVIGSRMMGGGFGGCTINLIKKELAESFIQKVKKLYQEKFEINLEIYEVNIVDGVKSINL